MLIFFLFLTVSDRCFIGAAQDVSGARVRSLINDGSLIDGEVTVVDCIPDEKVEITSKLTGWCDKMDINIILTVGGTGFSPRDVTPEATKQVIQREAPGLSVAMIKGSLDITPLAMLSRPVCGIRNKSLIINLPGSPKAAEENLRIIAPSLQHAVDLIHGLKNAETTHKKMQSESSETPTSHSHHHQHRSHQSHSCPHHSLPGAVAHRPRQSEFPMIKVNHAQSIVLEHCQPLVMEKVHFLDGIDRILGTDVFSHDPLPPFPASMKDGYAVIAADGPGLKKVLGVSIAGSRPQEVTVRPGYCARISTGAPLPMGADSVVMVEETRLISASDDGRTEIEIEILSNSIQHGQEIRPVGSDIREGEKVLAKGTLLTASDIGVLAAVGAMEIDVNALPTVAVLSTGNELEESKPNLQHGFIRDSNRPTLLSLFKQNGFTTIDAGIAYDDVDIIKTHVENALQRADILVSTGGVSMGEKDLIRHVLTSHFQARVHFGRVDMKPGKPTTFATCQFQGKTKLIFGLPGNPVSAVVTAYLYVLPACRKIAGHQKPLPTVIKAQWKATTSSPYSLDSRPEYHRVSLLWDEASDRRVTVALSTGNQISSRLLSLSNANGLAILPAKSHEMSCIADGTMVDVIVIDKV